MSMFAPYHESMRLGSGFNSFTQELCIDSAVTREDKTLSVNGGGSVEASKVEILEPVPVPQSVSYKTSIIDKASDVLDSMNIEAAFSIKFGQSGGANGDGMFKNLNKIKSSDLTYMVAVKVVNQVKQDTTLTKFSTLPGMRAEDFPKVYGDCFISGFQEGGEMVAIISIRAKDRSQAHAIRAQAAVDLTLDKVTGNLNGVFKKSQHDLLTENETTITVTYTGGGQGLKKPEEDWTFDTMRAAALKFPELVAKCPMRTQAVLTKYNALRSFHSLGAQFNPLNYENARVYTKALQEAFLDYQNISKNLQVLAFDTAAGTQRLVSQKDKVPKDFGKQVMAASNPNLLATMTDTSAVGQLGDLANNATGDSTAANTTTTTKSVDKPDESKDLLKPSDTQNTPLSEDESVVDVDPSNPEPNDQVIVAAKEPAVKPTPPPAATPYLIDKPYPATIQGLESARMQVRFMLNRIVSEVDVISQHPEVATDETRSLTFMPPFLFSQLLPVGVPVPS